jgi:hypothetical protein
MANEGRNSKNPSRLSKAVFSNENLGSILVSLLVSLSVGCSTLDIGKKNTPLVLRRNDIYKGYRLETLYDQRMSGETYFHIGFRKGVEPSIKVDLDKNLQGEVVLDDTRYKVFYHANNSNRHLKLKPMK